MILKPAEQSPLTAIRLAELAAEAGIPEGVFNVLPGFGETAGQALGRHMDVDVLAFTGSTEVGKYFLRYSGESNMKQIWLECGGKSPNIVLGDAPNLDVAAQRTAFGIWFNQGEVCTAGSRLIVEDKIKDAFLEKVMAIGQKMMPGDPLDPKTQMGAMVDETQTKRVMGYIDAGNKEGAKLRMGGKQVHIDNAGSFIEPTVFDDVDNKMKIAQEEIFGPVLSVIPFEGRRAGAERRQRHDLRPRLGDLHVRHQQGLQVRQGPARRLGVGQLPTTAATSPRRSAATSSRASAATSRCTPSTSSPRSRRPGSSSAEQSPLAGVVDVLELQAVRIGEEHRIVAIPVLRILRRRVQDGHAGFGQPRMEAVDILSALSVPREVVQAHRVAVVLARMVGRPDGDAADAVGQREIPDDDVVAILHAAIAEEAQHQFVEQSRPSEIAHGEVEVVHLATHRVRPPNAVPGRQRR